ncbi:hypothetical protein D3C85_1064560 [compost metagenome]
MFVIARLVVIVIITSQCFTAELGHHHHFARHRRQGLARQRHDGRDGRTGDNLAIGQGPGTRRRQATAQGEWLTMKTLVALLGYRQARALFEHVVDAPHGPHALGEVRVEVAVVDRIADHPVTVAGPAVGDFIGVARAWADTLGVHVVGVVVIGVEQPLVTVQVENVLLVPGADVAKLHRIAQVAMGNVGRFGRVQRHGRLDTGALRRRHLPGCELFQADVGRHVHQHGDIADRVGAEEELFISAGQAVMHGADADAVGDYLGAHAAGTVVDHEGVTGRVEHLAKHRVAPEPREGLDDRRLVVEHRGEIAKRFQAVGVGRVTLALAFQRIGGGWETAVGIGPHD